jgi:GT2 family glycosyltransferase
VGETAVNHFSIVIPSRNIGNLTACVSAVRNMGETARVIVVDDGIMIPVEKPAHEFLPLLQKDVEFIKGIRPFVFARNVNRGIKHAGTDDLLVLNDDALLKTPRGFSRLQKKWHKHQEYGAIAAAVDYGGTVQQLLDYRNPGLRTLNWTLAFVCVFLPRGTIDTVGLLDERFSVNAEGPGKRGYGCDDDDYCWRIRQAGLKLGVYDGCFVNHTSLPSTFRNDPERPWDADAHREVFKLKWGTYPR